MNQVCLTGRLGHDPELRFIPSGTAVCNASIAVERSYKQGDEWKKETSWVDLVVWGKLGERMATGLAKGDLVTVRGYLRQETWEKDGQKRSALKVVVEEATKGQTWGTSAGASPSSGADEDIPF